MKKSTNGRDISTSNGDSNLLPEEVAGHLLTGCEYINIPLPLANLVGLDGAVIMKVIENWCISNARHRKSSYYKDGHWWTTGTYKDWLDQLKFFGSAYTIQRLLLRLEKQGVVVSRSFSKTRFDKTKWYRIDRKQLGALYLKEFGDIFSPPEEAEITQNPIVAKSHEDSSKIAPSSTANSLVHLLVNKNEVKKEREEQEPSLSEELLSEDEGIPDSIWEKIANEAKGVEEEYLDPPNNSSPLADKKSESLQPTDNPSPGSNKSAATFLSPKETNPELPYKLNNGEYKEEFVCAIAKYLSGTPHYKDSSRKADREDAIAHIANQETRGNFKGLLAKYRKYCTTRKSSGVEGASIPIQGTKCEAEEDNLYRLRK